MGIPSSREECCVILPGAPPLAPQRGQVVRPKHIPIRRLDTSLSDAWWDFGIQLVHD